MTSPKTLPNAKLRPLCKCGHPKFWHQPEPWCWGERGVYPKCPCAKFELAEEG